MHVNGSIVQKKCPAAVYQFTLMYKLENNKNFYKNSEDVGMAQKAQKQERDVTQ